MRKLMLAFVRLLISSSVQFHDWNTLNIPLWQSWNCTQNPPRGEISCIVELWVRILYTNSPRILFTNDRNQFLSLCSCNWDARKYHNLECSGLCHRVWNLHRDGNPLVPELSGHDDTNYFRVWLCFRQILPQALTLSPEIFRGSCYRTCNPSGSVNLWGCTSSLQQPSWNPGER